MNGCADESFVAVLMIEYTFDPNSEKRKRDDWISLFINYLLKLMFNYGIMGNHTVMVDSVEFNAKYTYLKYQISVLILTFLIQVRPSMTVHL